MTLDLTTVPTVDPRAAMLRGMAGGTIHLPGDAGYEQARLPWNVAVDQRPAAVALPTTPREVSQVVTLAREAGLRVAPQSTGHNAGPLAAQGLDDVVVVRTSRMARVGVDPRRRIARVEGGALWLPAVEAAAEHGLATLHGSSPDVGIAGYSLGGGLGWYARKLGLATNSLTAVEVVLADGSLVRADAHRNRELFWALRGGGGSFGVVTALEFRLYPVRTAYAGMLVWDVADTERVLRRWAQWAPGAPDEVTTAFRVLRVPPLPEVPEPLRGRSLVVVGGAVLGSDTWSESVLRGLRELRPEIDTFARVPARTLSRLHMDPEGPTPAVSGTSLLGDLPDAGVDAFVDAVGPDSTTSLLAAELRQLGGAVGRPHPGGGVLDRIEAAYALFGVAVAPDAESGARGRADAGRLVAALSGHATGRTYLNFAEDAVDPRTGYAEDRWLQLTGIRTAVDPGGLFVGNHRVPRLYEGGGPTA